jgi:glycosyltransferase involved in cell wall biosynthesis
MEAAGDGMISVAYLVGTLEAGGLERFVTRVCLRAKAGNEFSPMIICLRARRGRFLAELEAARVRIYEVSGPWARHMRPLWQFSSLVREITPTVVHSQVNFALLQQWIAVRTAGVGSFCVTERNCYNLEGAALARRRLQFRVLRRVGAHYSANSHSVAAHLANQVRVPSESITIIPNGISPLCENPQVRSAVRSRFGWKDDDVSIGCVARLAGVKGHATLIRAMAELQRRGIPFRGCFVGDGPERLSLVDLAKELGVSDRVTFTGTVANVEDYLQAFDIVALLSTREGMPNAVLEAMAAGKPSVGTPVGAIPELLDDGNAGVVLSNRDPHSVALVLSDLAGNPDRRLELGRRARQRAISRYGFEAMFTRLVDYYKEVSRAV